MAKPYAKLRGIMREHEDTQATLGRLLLLSTVSVSQRFSNRQDWKLSEMYAVLDHYNIPHNKLHLLFPANGRNEQCTR